MANNKGNPAPRDEDNSRIQASDSRYSLPEEAREVLNDWLFAKRLKKYRQMKQMEAGEGLQDSPGVARDFHSSSPGNGEKVDEAGNSDVVAFDGDAGPEVAFVERDVAESGDTEFEDFDGVPVC